MNKTKGFLFEASNTDKRLTEGSKKRKACITDKECETDEGCTDSLTFREHGNQRTSPPHSGKSMYNV